MKTTLVGLTLASVVVTVGCTQAIARHDVFERSDTRVGHLIDSARQACQQRQPKIASLSAADYEQCLLATLRGAELTVARH